MIDEHEKLSNTYSHEMRKMALDIAFDVINDQRNPLWWRVDAIRDMHVPFLVTQEAQKRIGD